MADLISSGSPLFRLLRRRLLPLFRRFNLGDITIRHQHTGDRIRIHSFRHKSYWFHGQHHEQPMLRLFRSLVPKGATVLDIGGHIGYTTLYLTSLVGPAGRVIVFEPGPDNLKYLKRNLRHKPNVVIMETAVTGRSGRQTLFVEDLTGQNNSFIPDFDELQENARSANIRPRVEAVPVDTISLDDFCQQHGLCPNFIKIDVEGLEFDVLSGAARLLTDCRPTLLTEILPSNRQPAWELLRRHRYTLLSEAGRPLFGPADLTQPNALCVPEEKLAALREQLAQAALH